LVDPWGDGPRAAASTDPQEHAPPDEHLLLADRLTAVGTLAAGAAHEINNPLTYSLLNLEHVLRRLRIFSASGASSGDADLDAELPSLVGSLEHALQGMVRVRDIVRNLVTFSRGRIATRALVDIRSVLESSIQMALHEIENRARIVRDFGDVPPVEADEARLSQVFLGLLVNAGQAIPEGDGRSHHVRVATRSDQVGNVVVEVSDSGVGIAPEVMPRIFDPFFTSKGLGGATGLGLWIAHGTVRALGGDIHVASTLGEGTTFRVTLPAARGWRSSRTPATAERRRVLVIDDDALVGAALARAIGGQADVQVLTDAREAVARLATGERWDVILCDLLMPGMSGMDVYAEALRGAPDAIPSIVFMTGGASTPRARAFLDGVANPCLEKPIDLASLRRVIARVRKA
jgi:CheY-like chemotaxis protein